MPTPGRGSWVPARRVANEEVTDGWLINFTKCSCRNTFFTILYVQIYTSSCNTKRLQRVTRANKDDGVPKNAKFSTGWCESVPACQIRLHCNSAVVTRASTAATQRIRKPARRAEKTTSAMRLLMHGVEVLKPQSTVAKALKLIFKLRSIHAFEAEDESGICSRANRHYKVSSRR